MSIPNERAERLAELVKSALELPAESWPAFLDQECKGDSELRHEIESLLAQQQGSSGFLEEPALGLAAENLVRDGACAPGQILGDYKILSFIARGGMGEVYLARDRQLERKVALKLIRRGMNSAEIVRHFQREERLLASLNHPNIAQLYGGGVTPDGMPFFAMEYVDGQRLDEHCAERSLTTRQRLELFRKVCAAVTYAHQRLVIHRDIKPANIRVTAEGEPKLLDFGIAKLLEPETSLGQEPTLTLASAMTPDYASPEQVRGETVATTSDVYSLGVVLYRLLTGQGPYRTKTTRPEELARAITDQEPERPSTALANNQKSAIRNQQSLEGDLDNIILQAMRKEPERRYTSVGQFSEDIRRHLEGLPVTACRDTWSYRSAKFFRRHRVGAAAAALVLLSLIAGIVATAFEARRADRQRDLAERRFDDVRQLAHSLMFDIHDSVQNLQGSTPTLRLIVSRALEYLDRLAHETGDNPDLQRELATGYEKIGDIQGNPYSANLGDTDGALTSYRKALAIRKALRNSEPEIEMQMELGRTYRGLGDILEQKGNVADCISNYRRSLSIFQQLAATKGADFAVQDELARAYGTMGDGLARTAHGAAERLACYQKALSMRQGLLAKKPSDRKMRRAVADSFLKVGIAMDARQPGAGENARSGAQMLESLSAEDPDDARARREVGFAYYDLGGILVAAKDYAGALPARQKAFAIRQEIARHDPKNAQAAFDFAVAHADLAEVLALTGGVSDALEHAQASLKILEQLSAADPTNAVYRRNLGLAQERMAAVSELAGRDETQPLPLRLENLHQAHASYEKARDVFIGLQDRQALMPNDSGQVGKFNANLAAIDQEIARLDR